MRSFKYIDEVSDWLEHTDYQGFWHLVAPYDLVLQPKAHCNLQIASGGASEDLVLNALKSMAEMELTKRHDLNWKPSTPWLKLAANH